MSTKQMLAALLVLVVCPCLLFGGTISGKVTYTGTPAKQKSIDMSKEPSCAKQHATPVTVESVVTGTNNALENVVVYVSSGAVGGWNEMMSPRCRAETVVGVVRTSVPTGAVVPIEFMAGDPGEHEFTCQMGMLRGRIIVEAS